MHAPTLTDRLGVLAVIVLLGNSLISNAQGMGEPDLKSHSPIDPAARTAEWMLEQSEPRMRAAALVVLADNDDQDRSTAIIENVRGTTDGAAMLWLAHACQQAEIQRECMDAGLDQAIVRYDNANVFARVPLHETADIADLILETRRESMYYFSLIETWYDALGRSPTADADSTPGERLGLAFAIGAAWPIPALATLTESCRSSIRGGDVDRACQQLAGRVIESGESLLASMIAKAIQRRGEAASDEDRSVVDQRSAQAGCQMESLQPVIDRMDDTTIRDFLDSLQQHGELDAWSRLAEQHDIDCSDAMTPAEEAALYQEQMEKFNAVLLSIAQDLLDSSSERERAAGLTYLLTKGDEAAPPSGALIDELDRQIRSTRDGAALAWLAKACGQIGFSDFCLHAGLDAAIVEHDRGNLFSRSALLGSSRIGSALAESLYFRSYYADLAAVWYPVIKAHQDSLALPSDTDVLTTAFVAPGTLGTPGLLSVIANHCWQRKASELNAVTRCRRLARSLIESGRTSYEQLGGLGLMHRLAELRGEDAEADRLAALRERSNEAYSCLTIKAWQSERGFDAATVEQRLAESVEYGEWIALQRAGERLDVDCPRIPSSGEILHEHD